MGWRAAERAEEMECCGLCAPWDQVRVGKAAGRNPIWFGEGEMDSHIMAGGWKMSFEVPSRIILGFCGLGKTTQGQPGYKILDGSAGLGPVGGDSHNYFQESAAVGSRAWKPVGTCDLLTPKEFVKDSLQHLKFLVVSRKITPLSSPHLLYF